MDKGECDFQMIAQLMNKDWKALMQETLSPNFS